MGGLMIDQNKFSIGSRIKVNDDFGIVKYIGEVQGYTGIWLGVEWDNPIRGKHDGAVNGTYYFQTEHPTSGSMIRINKVEKFQSLEEAIRTKYICEVDCILDETLLKDAQKQFHANVFEIVGLQQIAQKQSKIEELENISFKNSPINSAGDLRNLTKLTTLNINSSLIWNWNIIADIAKQLPSLNYISLSSNRLVLPQIEEIEYLEPNFRNLKGLILGNCGISNWDDLKIMAMLWPNIEMLGLQENNISKITNIDCTKIFKKLKKLDLHLTKISNFEEIIKLGCINTLEILLLMQNNIESLQLPDCDPDKRLNIFENLREINLLHNPMQDNPSIYNELDKLKSLKCLYKTHVNCPFDEMFSMAVGLIQNLEYLNRTFITKESRRGAEYDIWKKHGEEWLQTESNEEKRYEFSKKYRNYNNLLLKNGSPADFVKPEKKVSNLVKLKIENKITGEIWEKKVLRKLSLQTLQGLIIKQFKLKSTPKISYMSPENKKSIFVFDNMSRNLEFYSVQDNDLIIVE